MSYPNEVINAKAEEPEFQKLLFALRMEICTTSELSSRVFYYANNLQTIPEQSNDNKPVAQKEPIGVVEMLWEEFRRLRMANQTLQITADHLQKVVGS